MATKLKDTVSSLLSGLASAIASAATSASSSGSGGGSSGTASKTSSSSGSSGSYTPMGSYDPATIYSPSYSAEDSAALKKYGEDYNYYKSIGDEAGMKASNEGANSVRAKYGYTGGTDGSLYQPLQQVNPVQQVQQEVAAFDYDSAPTYVSQRQSQIDQLWNEIMGTPAFSYDYNTDPLYQQYAQSYERNGNQAMQNTLGQMAARTGGLASSYAGSAAQQTYDNYMAGLADKIPELQQLAYSMYQTDLGNKRSNLNTLLDLENMDYNQYLTRLGQYNTDRNFAYNNYRDTIGDQQWQKQFDYNAAQDSIANNQWQQQFDASQSQWQQNFDQALREYDDSRSDNAYQQALNAASTLASYGDFSGYKALGYSDDQISNMQKQYAAQTAAKASSGGSSGSRSGGGSSGGGGTVGELYRTMAAAGVRPNEAAVNYWLSRNGYTSQAARDPYVQGYIDWLGGGDLSSLDYRPDEGVFTWGGREFPSLGSLREALDRGELTREERESVERKLAAWGF